MQTTKILLGLQKRTLNRPIRNQLVYTQTQGIFGRNSMMGKYDPEQGEKHLRYLYDNVYALDDPCLTEEQRAQLAQELTQRDER